MQVSPATNLLLGAALLAATVLAPACSRGEREPRTALTNAELRPQNTGPSSRTTDNSGFIDNGGRSSAETNRTETSGMRATESGSDRPTGTPGVGLPLPLDPQTPAGVREGSELTGQPAVPEREPDTVARLTRAHCDREVRCNRVGQGRLYASEEACMAQQEERVSRYVDAVGCARGIDGVHLAICLGAVQNQACTTARQLDASPQCRRTALCAP